MGYVWDYFMRRKPLLLTLVAIFALSFSLSGYFLQKTRTETPTTPQKMVKVAILNPEDIVEQPEVEVPLTRGDDETEMLVRKIQALLLLQPGF